MVHIVELKVREINFEFPDTIPFQWNPENPYWGNFVNFISLIAPAFEGYFVKAFKDVMPRITNPEIAKEAEVFCLQERQHSKQHLAHVKLLIKKHPGLEHVFLDVKKSYKDLYERESSEFHLAYAATLELCFGPVAKFIIENREVMFKGADPTISAFMLWHLVEEFEHRNSAYNIFNNVAGSYLYRLKVVFSVIKHLAKISSIVCNGLERIIPVKEGEVGPTETVRFMKDVPLASKLVFFYELLCTLLPYHNPNNIKQPAWATQWFADEAAGKDMRLYYPS